MAYQSTNVFLGNNLIGRSYVGNAEIAYTPVQAPGTGYIIRTDPYASYIAYAQPMNYFSGSFGMTGFDSDIHASIKGSGTNYYFPVSGSGTYVANGSKTKFSSDGYNTSLALAGDQNAGAWGSTTIPSDLDMSNSNFVWEAYVNVDSVIQDGGIFLMAGYGNTGNWSFNGNPAYIRFLIGPGDHYADSATNLDKSANTWHHWAFVRSGNNFYAYWDGVKVLTFSGAYTIGVNSPTRLLGAGTGYSTTQIAQYQDFRIYKGTDKGYTGATITPPQSMVTIG